jgi:hypothetical protein
MTFPRPVVIERVSGRALASKRDDLSAVRWRVSPPLKGRRVEIWSERGYCAGEPPPKLQATHIVERGKSVYIKAYVQKSIGPRGQEPKPQSLDAGKPFRASDRGSKPQSIEVCGGLGGFQHGIIKFRRNADQLKLYDAATSPPTLRWPRQVKAAKGGD